MYLFLNIEYNKRLRTFLAFYIGNVSRKAKEEHQYCLFPVAIAAYSVFQHSHNLLPDILYEQVPATLK